MLTQERLKELLHYDPSTGDFTWKVSRKGTRGKGSIAGCPRSPGYNRIGIFGHTYEAHRLVFLYCEGYFPENMVDHINRDPSDNRRENLREVTSACNQRNSKIPHNNTSGITGITWDSNANKWKAQITVNFKNIYLGIFNCKTEAVANRLAAEQCLDWSTCNEVTAAKKYILEYQKRNSE